MDKLAEMLYFANPLFLIALVGAVVPVVIHLVKLRRYRKVWFSNTEMLSELESEHRNRSRLREWLVLAARVLAIVFMVLAFAQPKVRKADQTQLVGGTCVSVYVDNSFSMGSEGQEGILLEQAKAKAREIVGAYPTDTKYQIVTNDNGGQRRRAMTKEEFVEAVDGIELCEQSIGIAEAMMKQKDFGAIASCANTYAYVVSDFQETACDWEEVERVAGSGGHGLSGDNGGSGKGLDAVSFTFVPLMATGQGNVYIDSVWIDAPIASVGSEARLTVRVCNTGDKRVETLPVRLYINGEQKAVASVDIDKRSHVEAKMAFSVHETGVQNGYVETDDYPVTFDDRLFFSVNVKPRLKVHALYGTGANAYIKRLFDGDSLCGYRESGIVSADFSDIDETDLVTVTSVGSMQSGIAQRLATYVEEGGSLLVAPAADCDIQSYNTLLTALNAPQLEAFEETKSACTWLNSESPLYNGVFRRVDDNMELPTVNGYYRLKAATGGAYEDIIRMANGMPYLVAVTSGQGVAWLLTAPMEEKYSDFMQQALFVPTVYNMALYSRPVSRLYYTIGRETMVEVAAGGSSMKFAKEGEAGSTVAEVRHNGRHSYLMADAMEVEVGNYRLTDGAAEQGVSFNYGRRESVMQFVEPKELEAAIEAMQTDNVDVFTGSAKPLDELIKQRSGGRSLAVWCIVGALIMLLCETLLLRWPGRR